MCDDNAMLMEGGKFDEGEYVRSLKLSEGKRRDGLPKSTLLIGVTSTHPSFTLRVNIRVSR